VVHHDDDARPPLCLQRGALPGTMLPRNMSRQIRVLRWAASIIEARIWQGMVGSGEIDDDISSLDERG
jgi:hypothetical protein